MGGQPTGTVTLVFTDIEGSTRLLERLGQERYRESLELHRRLLREALERYGGYEVDSEGDAFFVAFSRAEDAVAAAAGAQLALGEAEWPERLRVRVRIGVHTGEPLPAPPKYVGLDVHKAARVMAAAHGGQVVVTRSTRELLDDQTELVDLGEHRLKDLSAPQRLYQLGEGEFPPLKTLYRSNLPVPATPFLGRERELLELGRLLGDPLNRVVTALGPGGAGKTRLALQAVGAEAERFPGGLVWVPLASAADMEGAVAAVAQALDVGERPGYSLIDVVTEVLAGGSRRLLLLDNLEHLLPAFAEAVSVIVRHAPAVTVVATSRERLRVAGERVYELPTLAEADARELFKARAAAITLSPSGDDDAVSELCRRLDFLPLAIELAAARTALFTPEQLLARLGKRLDLLRGSRDADPRHATLRATIEWSFGLLDAEEQRLLCALSIFPAGCTYEMAEAVCDCEPMLLEALIDKSLVRRRETVAEPRYWMLETIREFARPLLEQADVYDEVRRKFMAAQRDFAAAYEPSWLTKDSTLWYRRFQLELDNLREAMAISAATGDHETVLATAGDLTGGWQRAGLLHEGTDRVLDALGRASEAPSGTVGMAQFCLGVLASESGNTTEALEQLRAALPLVDPYRPEIGVFARYLIFELTLADDRPEAAKVLEEAARVAETTDNPTLIIITLLSKAELLASEDPVRAYELAARAVEVARGWEAGRLVEALHGFGVVAENAGDRQQARAALNEAVLLARDELERGDAGAGDDALVSLGLLAALDNERDAAAACGERLHAHLERRDSVAPPIAAQLAVLDAAVAALEGRREDAVRLIGAAEETLRLTSAPAFLIAAKTYDALLAPLRLALEP